MADVVLTVAKSLVEGTLTKAQLAIEEEEKLRQRAQRDLVFIAGEFQMMQSFLSIITKENVKNKIVNTCVTQVRDLAYDVEDCIEFIVHLDTKPYWWCRLIPSCMAPARPLDKAVDMLQHLKERVQDVSQRSERYKLISDDSGSKPVKETRQPAAAGASLDMDDLTMLITESGSDLQVISVWASGGDHGAASIIRKAYEKPKIRENFSRRAWVKLVHPLNLPDCLIQQELDYQKYLVVLEDVSTTEDWNAIRGYLPDRRNGSRIVVLTRQFQVASFCTGCPYIQRFWADYPFGVLHKQGPLIGRTSEINELRKYPPRVRSSALQVMSVWGIAGAGKSALVRNLYQEMLDTKEYGKYIWVDVNKTDLSQGLLLQIRSNCLEANEDPVKECGDLLRDHRCLVVIDNLKSTEEWDIIQDALESIPSKKVIIVTTNKESTALHCADRNDLVFNVKGLEVGAAIDLFKKEVKKNPNISVDDINNNNSELRQLISKCGEIPEVIVAVADYLAGEFNWELKAKALNDQFVSNLETWSEFACLRGLFSWMHSYLGALPELLRQHIAYLLIFPAKRSIRRRRLLMRWVAEGYSRDSDRYTANENGEKLFANLVELSMIHPPLLTTITHMRMVSYEISDIFHEYMVTRPQEENIATAIEVFALRGTCSPTSRRRGRHLVVEQNWDRDKIVFENIDFSRLRSLTVFGKWESFFISESMKVLRVLDLEDASGMTNKDLQKMLNLLPRLKFLSLRGCSGINYLPSSVGNLRQLQTLDIRYTSVVTLPASITKLKKLHYIRAGTTAPREDPSAARTVVFKLSKLCRCFQLVGVEVLSGIGKLTALHTVGVVNIDTAGGKGILKELMSLTQLRKLGVSGVSKKNWKEFCSTISVHSHLESLSVWLKKNQDCLDAMHPNIVLPKKLQSLKLYGLASKLSAWIDDYNCSYIRKLNFEANTCSEDDVKVLGGLPQLCILCLRVKQLQDGELNFRVMTDGVEDRSYEKVKILAIACCSSLLNVTFGSVALQNLELLKAGRCGTGSLQFARLEHLSKLKEVQVIGSHDDELQEHLKHQVATCTSQPALTRGDVNQSSHRFPFFPTTPSMQP